MRTVHVVLCSILMAGVLGAIGLDRWLNQHDIPGDGIMEAASLRSRSTGYDRVVLCRFTHAGETVASPIPEFSGHVSVAYWDCSSVPICIPRDADRTKVLEPLEPYWEVGRGGRRFIGFTPTAALVELNRRLDPHCRPNDK